MSPNLGVNICGIDWKNPITTAAGTFNGFESTEYYNPVLLGAVTTKGVSLEPWEGNSLPRIAEAESGVLNSVGLENKGVHWYVQNELPRLKMKGVTVIANLAGHSHAEYVSVAEVLGESDVDMLELNISCPNVKEGGISFGTDPVKVRSLVAEVKKVTNKPLIVKLSPNVTDITEIALAAQNEGADAISMINTLVGMKIDIESGKAILANKTGGLSGPAIKPIALRMLYDVVKVMDIPVIGMGGIMTGEDAVEFFMAGASAVAVGTAALIDPVAPIRILNELERWMKFNNVKSIKELREVRFEL